jgi:Phosphate-induced protein 1 conserved region
MRKSLVTFLVMVVCLTGLHAQPIKRAIDQVPTGKGWGVDSGETRRNTSPKGGTGTTNGMNYHGGPVMRASRVNVYFIWYGNWTNGPLSSDRQATVGLLDTLFAPTRGMGGSGFFKITSTYSDTIGSPTGNIALAASTTNHYSHGKLLADADVQNIVSGAISSGSLPKDINGVYFVLTSSDVNETSGFCTLYCGWHTRATIGGTDIKYAFVGNADRCPNACEMQTASPNGDSAADGMASIMAHEAMETVTDPDLNAWYDSSGNEIGDKCAWKFGPVTGAMGQGAYNQTFGTYNWLIQMGWENSRGGGCDKTLGGKFYNQ